MRSFHSVYHLCIKVKYFKIYCFVKELIKKIYPLSFTSSLLFSEILYCYMYLYI